MNQTTQAVYADGVLRPIAALPLADGERVEITVRKPPFELPDRAKLSSMLARLHQLDAEAANEPDDGYDVSTELNAQRARIGARPIAPDRVPDAPQ